MLSRLINCYNPKSVFNKYLGEFVYARCGKCPACLDARAAEWVTRLQLESMSYRYQYFVTLQYNEQSVNQLVRLRKEDYPGIVSYIDSLTGEIVSLDDKSVGSYTQKDVDFCYDTKVLNVHNYRDFQLFLKRLRKHINKYYGKGTILQYACALEYGPTTYRPHLHCLFFFNSSLLAKDFKRLLPSFWYTSERFGNSFRKLSNGCTYDPHSVYGSAASYVASYVNCFSNLPAIYRHKSIRPRFITSKKPSIAFDALTRKTLRELFFASSDVFQEVLPSDTKFRDVSLWSSIRNRLYPTVQSFSSLSLSDRIKVYRFGLQCLYITDDPKTYCRLFETHWDSFLSDYARKCFYKDFNNSFNNSSPRPRLFNADAVKYFIRQIKRVAENSSDFGISFIHYVELISKYYDKKQKSDFHDFLRLQDDYFKNHPVSDYLSFFPTFYNGVNGKRYGTLKPWQKFYLDIYFGFELLQDDFVQIEFSKVSAHKELVGLHNKIFSDNTKTKQVNDYLLANKEKFQNIINYKDYE